MSPVIRISDEIFQRLQKHATPLVDTPATVIEKILDYCENGEIIESRKITKSTEINSNKDDFIKLDPDSPQDLTHTKILNGMFGNKKILNWNSLIQVAHIYAMEKTEDFLGYLKFQFQIFQKVKDVIKVFTLYQKLVFRFKVRMLTIHGKEHSI